MLPQAVVTPLELVVQALAVIALDQAFAAAAFFDHDHSQLGVDFSFAGPVATGCAYFYLSREDKFFAHGLLK